MKLIKRLIYRWRSNGDVHRLVNILTGREVAYMEPEATGRGAEVTHYAQIFKAEGQSRLRVPSEFDLSAAKQIVKNRACE